jgi:hypothetical protein
MVDTHINKLPYRISHKLKIWRCHYWDSFVFIHINKTGGSSIERALNLPFEHKTALEKRKELGLRQWEKKFKFAVIRNPWDKVVSHYHYRVQTNQTNLGNEPPGFQKWVRLTYGCQDSIYYDKPKMFMPQWKWLSDCHGKLIVDHICRFENLADDFRGVCQKIGKDPINLPHLKASKRGSYRDYYDDPTAKIVKNWFRLDIEKFEYQF